MIQQFRAKLAKASSQDAGSASAVAMPYGAVIEHLGERVTFDEGSISVPSDRAVPVNIDHGDGVLERIGKLTGHTESDAGLEVMFEVSDTAAGRDVLTLLRDGVLEDVSAGVAIAAEEEIDGVIHKSGELDHLAIVGRGAFGAEGSKVLSVHKEGSEMKDETTTEETPPVETHSAEVDAELLELRQNLATIEGKLEGVTIAEANPLERYSLDQVVKSMVVAQHRGAPVEIDGVSQEMAAEIARFVLADDTVVTAAGLVPDFQSSEIISIVDTDRAYISEHPKDPIGNAGMSIDYPIVVTKPSVDAQVTNKSEVDSTAMDIDTQSHALTTVAGASDVAIQLIERSSPSFVTQLFREYAHVYAVDTEARSTATAVAGAGGTAILADLGADAALTQAAVLAGNTAIIAAVRRPATHMFLATDRWEQILSLVDSTGRPLVATTPGSQRFNAPGVVVGNRMVGEYLGLKVVLVPDAATGTCLIENVDRGAAILEQSPQQLRALQVDLLGWNMGIYAYFATAVKYAGGLYTLTLA